MSETKIRDISQLKFESTVFPTEADMKLWNSLTPEEKRAVIARDLDAAERSGIAEKSGKQDIIAEVEREMRSGL